MRRTNGKILKTTNKAMQIPLLTPEKIKLQRGQYTKASEFLWQANHTTDADFKNSTDCVAR
jgi:hypothetical protein